MSSHAINRALERFGMDLTIQDLHQITEKIASGEAKKDLNRQDTWLVNIEGRLIPFVYTPIDGILTVLPAGYNKRKFKKGRHPLSSYTTREIQRIKQSKTDKHLEKEAKCDDGWWA